jgi:DNA (cytosine-5)-methyltransferase 1
MQKIKVIDLFAGTGAFSYAFSKYDKFKTIYSNDMVKESEEIIKLNDESINFVLEDINKINPNTIPNHNIMCAGFPCQPFSISGQQKGFDDERSNVFWKMLEIIQHHNPEILVLENVKNLKSHDKGNTFKIIEENLIELGYYIKYDILDTCKITYVPHHRERVYMVCFKNKDLYDKFDFNFVEVNNKPIKDFLENKIHDKYYYTNKLKIYDLVKKEITKNIDENVLYQYRRFYVRENKSNVCPTLTANMGEGGHNVPLLLDYKGIRKLTPRECFNLQGFPKDYKLPKVSDSNLYKLAGNAISIPVIELIVEKLNNIL